MMNKIKLFLIFVLVLLAVAPVLGEVCSFKPSDPGCAVDETGVLSIYDLTNSHLSYYGHSATSYDLCCKGVGVSVSNGCSDTYLVSMSGAESSEPFNQHAGDSTNYVNDVCLENVNACYFSSDCGSDECVLSLSGVEDAHVGDCSASYTNKVCCVFDTTPPVLTVSSPENIAYNINQISIDFTSDTATDSLWFVDNESVTHTYTEPTTVTLDDGYHTFGLFAKDLANNEAHEERVFLVDTVDPVFAQSFHYSTQSKELTVIVFDEFLDSCWYVNPAGENVLVNCNDPFVYPGLEGLNTVIIWAKDVAGNTVNREFTLTQDTELPIFTNIDDLSFTSQQKVEFTFDAADVTSDVDCFGVNDSRFEINCSGYLNTTPLSKGLYWLNISVNDSVGNVNNETIFVEITNVKPVIATIPKITFEEGWHYALNLSKYVSDPDDAFTSLLVRFSGNDSVKINYNPVTFIANFTAPLLWQGSERITLNVSDVEGYTEKEFIVEVGFGGCTADTRRCADGSCDDDCGDDELEDCDEDGSCEIGESCLCEDCLGEQSYCAADFVCSGVSQVCVEEDTCKTSCDSVCDSSECYGLDPDCDASGNVLDADGDGVSDCNDLCTGTSPKCTPDLDGCNYYANCEADPDNDPRHCTWKGLQVGVADSGLCDVNNEQYCWAETSPTNTASAPCCGDDSGETWVYVSDSEVLDIFEVGGSCVNGKWVEESAKNVVFYDLEIVLR